jgi:hypothetical protein
MTHSIALPHVLTIGSRSIASTVEIAEAPDFAGR